MFRIASEKDLRESFREIDQTEVILTTDLKFPLVTKDYLTWLEPSGVRAYLVFQSEGFKAPFGLVFRRDQTMGPSAAAMCEWCHSIRSGNEVGILTATSNQKKRVGISLCRDLSCGDKLRSAPSVHDIPSTASLQERVRQLHDKMAQFVRRELI